MHQSQDSKRGARCRSISLKPAGSEATLQGTSSSSVTRTAGIRSGSTFLERPIELDAVINTFELAERVPRRRNSEATARARTSMATIAAEPPGDILQRLVEAAATLYGSASAGVSIIEELHGEYVFRWHALAGPLASHRWETTPRDFSPCGTVIDRKAVQLMILPERHFVYVAYIKPQVLEVLLVPFSVREQLVGTVWLVSHEKHLKFDIEDVQFATEFARLASDAYQRAPSVQASKSADRRKDELLATLAEDLRDPSRNARVTEPASAADATCLMTRMRSGDQRALTDLHMCTFAPLYAVAHAILKSKEDAEEVVCETYAQAWRQCERYDPERATPQGWLTMMCRSRALDRLRYNRSRGAERVFGDVVSSREEVLGQEELLALFCDGSRLKGALAALSAERVKFLSLAFLQGLSVTEMAERTGTPLGTVKSHMRRGLAQLRRALEPRSAAPESKGVS